MKPKFFLIAFAIGSLVAAAGAQAKDETAATVTFAEPEKFTDFKMSFTGTDSERQYLEKTFRKEIEQVVAGATPPGYHLALRFLDIDMAGDFEPQRGPGGQDVRIMRGVYPPRIKVEYELTNEAGEVVASGERALTDLAYQNTIGVRTDRTLFYETELVSRLVREIVKVS